MKRKGFVVCRTNEGYEASLVVRRMYECLVDPEASEKGLIRVVDESGDGYLFSISMFEEIELPNLVKDRLRFSL